MSAQPDEVRSALQKAREALRSDNRTEARQWAERAAALAPQMEDPWLVLAAVASPRVSVEYIQKALKINPNSPRARRGMQWAMQRLREEPRQDQSEGNGKPLPRPRGSEGTSKPKRSALHPILLLGLGCLVCGAVAWSVSTSSIFASAIDKPAFAAPAPTQQELSWAQVEIAKPTYTPTAALAPQMVRSEPLSTLVPSIVEGPTLLPVEPPTTSPTDVPTEMAMEPPTEVFPPSPEPTWSGSLSIEYLADTPTAQIPTSAPAYASQTDRAAASGQHWIDVNLSQQMVYAYEGDSVVNSFLVSTGTWMHPTVTGQYHIYVKLRYTDMAGPDYYLPNVPFTMYFYKGYGLHGTYWHHNFGTPMSHGCVNLSIPEAEWLYNFASVGTLVNVHY